MIAAGGTGGHVYPALAVAEAMLARRPDVTLTFVGGVGDFARPLVEAAALPFEHYDEVRSGPLHGVPLPTILMSLIQLALGTVQAVRLVRARRPSALLLTGGWVGLPVALAGRVWGVPSLIYLPDIEPGLTIKVLRHIANQVAVTAQESQPYFKPAQMIVTGYPVRRDMIDAAAPDGKTRGMAHFGLAPDRRTIMVFGGSRGARSINTALLDQLPELLTRPVQILHVTGTLDWESIRERVETLKAQHPDRIAHYHPFPYLHDDMGLAFACADLVISRSGASVLGEFPLFSLASILVPYPHAWRYQKVNADYLEERGAARVVRDETLSACLIPVIDEVLFEKPETLDAMRAASAALRTGDGAWNVAQALARLSGERA
ncbi:MAG: UDP-N-acetylglucosamine--N-acetylmuramyl-(pentapeptide) pyrophosphoryl-undecaprenol N-acetylglucosamine transferase [bacterium]|nr:UDP-N-acetylglucosamine--N-acetylmuramyl-(pentapeptide) pyrophosphoryl-undecaprenol N-acetylglucosamine transferase [bacterium]